MRSLLVILLALCVLLYVTADESGVSASSSDGLSDKERRVLENGERFDFQAQVSSIMDIIIHSLYQKKEIFLREILSNGSDALDKIRFLALTDPAKLSDDSSLEIKIKSDSDAKTLTITDTGIGMTREELINNLGTVAKSGAASFLEKYGNSGDVSLIGQFGVGFYSVFLVADTVTVTSKHPEDKQHIWTSKADGSFVVSEDTEGPFLTRGTQITLHLKNDATEYLDVNKLSALVAHHSNFIEFPISLWKSTTVQVPVTEETVVETPAETTEEKSEEDVSISDDDSSEEPATPAEPKTRSEEVWDWERLNTNKAIWMRSSKDVSEEEYKDFYKALSKDTADPLTYTHFVGEGDVSMRAILFIPSVASWDFYEKFHSAKISNLKFFVRRVLITDKTDQELLPQYLSFIHGVVDSDSLPLHVSREILQHSKVLDTIKTKLVSKVLQVLRKLSRDEDQTEYNKFWDQFGKSIKLGLLDQSGADKDKLIDLMRFKTSLSNGENVSFETYVKRMKPKQKFIYYATGENAEAIKALPQLERLLKRGYEVVLLTEAIDEYVSQSIPTYKTTKLLNVAREGLKFGDDDEAAEKETKKDFTPFTNWLQKALGDKVGKVTISNRITKSPCVLVSATYGWTANMERIMKAQAFADPTQASYMIQKKTMEINPRHPVIVELRRKAEVDADSTDASEFAHLLYDSALLQSGYAMEAEKASEFSARMVRLISKGLNIDPDAEIPDYDEPAESTTEEEEVVDQDAEFNDEL